MSKSKKVTPKKSAKKIEQKLPTAAVERLRNGKSSIPMETKTLGLSYSVIQSALKRELGAAGYSALIKANRAAKSKGAKPKAAKKSPAKAAKKSPAKKSPKKAPAKKAEPAKTEPVQTEPVKLVA